MSHAEDPPSREALTARYRAVRAATSRLCEPLAVEDYVVQSMPDASPTKWHRAHTTWFFETFVLAGAAGVPPSRDRCGVPLQLVLRGDGASGTRGRARGLLSRPTAEEVRRYRARVDERVVGLLERRDRGRSPRPPPS